MVFRSQTSIYFAYRARLLQKFGENDSIYLYSIFTFNNFLRDFVEILNDDLLDYEKALVNYEWSKIKENLPKNAEYFEVIEY